MANEAVTIELQGTTKGGVVRYTVPNAVSIEKGTLLKLVDPRTVSGANIGSGDAFAGIAAEEKVANDGATSIGVYTQGIFDLTCNAGAGITAGAMVVMSGANLIRAAVAADLLTGAVVGKALETASANEVIAVKLGVYP